MTKLKSYNPVQNFYRASSEDFKKIPGSPIAYWVSERVRKIFPETIEFSSIAEPKKGITTSDNDKYIRIWSEVIFNKIDFTVEANNGLTVSKKMVSS